MKALVVVESVEWTPVRYELSMRFGECSAVTCRSARGL
jgi:hypothetical protein